MTYVKHGHHFATSIRNNPLQPYTPNIKTATSTWEHSSPYTHTHTNQGKKMVLSSTHHHATTQHNTQSEARLTGRSPQGEHGPGRRRPFGDGVGVVPQAGVEVVVVVVIEPSSSAQRILRPKHGNRTLLFFGGCRDKRRRELGVKRAGTRAKQGSSYSL